MAEEKTPPAETAPAKKSKKGLIIALASVLVLGGGGAGAYFTFAGKADEGDKAGKAEGKAEKAKDKKHQPEVKLPAVFVELDPPFVANFAPGSQARFLQISVQLMTRDAEVAKLLEHLKPILRNDLLQLFGNQQVAEVSTAEGKEALRSATLEAVRKVIASEGGKAEALEAVYFTSFVMQ